MFGWEEDKVLWCSLKIVCMRSLSADIAQKELIVFQKCVL